MQQNFTSVPFKSESSHGLTHVEGIAKFSAAGVILEFESKIIGLIKTGVKEVRLPLGEIFDVKFRKGFLKRFAKIEIRMTTIAKLNEVPNENGKITLKLTSDDFERGAEAVARLQMEMSGHKELEPPVHTPVSRLFGEDEDQNEPETKKL
jgi:hypothetical protein